mgnify:CR=1 FL=1|jgi:methionyl-tRNA formyltransferase
MQTINKKIIFWGTPLFALPSLKVLHDLDLVAAVVTQPDKAAGRNKKIKSSPVKIFAQENNIKILEPVKLDEAFINDIKKYLPAIFVVVAYGKIIPQDILDLSKMPAINIHPSMLPILRGPSPIQTAILKGFDSTGVSLMQLDKKMDHGPILSQIQAKISPNEDYFDLSERLSDLGADLLKKNIISYLEYELKGRFQDDAKATFCQMIAKADGQISWQKTSQELHNQVRAFIDWPGSFVKLNNLDIKILQTKISDQDLEPGKILIDNNKLYIGTNNKSLEVLKIQPAGKKSMTAEEFIRGYQNKL